MILALICLPALLAAAPPGPPPTLEEVRRESDPKQRFERAIALAETQADAARRLVRDAGLRSDLEKLLADVTGASSLALESLRSTGLRPSKLSKQYKKGEVKTRAIERVLGDLILALNIDDRPLAEKARDEVAITHEEFLLGVMGK